MEAKRIRVQEALENAGWDIEDMSSVEEMAMDSVVPACCSEGCEVEPDGKCSHGFPSVLIAMGVI